MQRIPYVRRGRTWAGADCWGIHRIYCAVVSGTELPLWDWIDEDDPDGIAGAIAEEKNRLVWSPIADGDERQCDLALMRCMTEAGPAPLHIGTVTGPRRIMHTTATTGVMCVPFDHKTVKNRINQIWRYEHSA
jgi:hypothetical protein